MKNIKNNVIYRLLISAFLLLIIVASISFSATTALFDYVTSYSDLNLHVVEITIPQKEENGVVVRPEQKYKLKYYDIDVSKSTSGLYTGEGITNPIAVAWSADDNANVNITDLVLPEDGKIGNKTICAIAKGGFMSCSFQTISLPPTIKMIEQEAFAFCQNLTAFTFPYGLKAIAPSAFMDCRSLEAITYADSNGERAFDNDSIESIGNHAFDSCVKLKYFYCPKKVTFFGEGCFQHCSSLAKFYFPSAITETKVVNNQTVTEITNEIEVESYAFAYCESLKSVYFETNMKKIQPFAFVGSNTGLTFYYTGSNNPESLAGISNQWKRKYLNLANDTTATTNNYTVVKNQNVLLPGSDYGCPGFRFTLEYAAVGLNSTNVGPDVIEIVPAADVEDESTYYVVIKQFDTPVSTNTYFDSNNVVTIPNTITVNGTAHPVKIIAETAFQENEDITGVVFNSNLVQIQKKAFYKCTNIASLDFSNATSLKEISSSIFQDVDCSKIENNKLKHINLPTNVEYIGAYAFYNFVGLESTTTTENGVSTTIPAISFMNSEDDVCSLKLIGNRAFAVYDKSTTSMTGTLDLIIPNSLNDVYAKPAKFTPLKTTWANPNFDENTIFAIGTGAFDNCDFIRTVKMQKATEDQVYEHNDDAQHTRKKETINGVEVDKYNMSHTTSFASNAFIRCNNIISFRSNDNVCFIGCDFLKDCPEMREVFLTTGKAERQTKTNYPWGMNDESVLDDSNSAKPAFKDSLFKGTTYSQNLVIYVDGSKAPKKLDDYSNISNTTLAWNAQAGSAYNHEANRFSNETNYFNRSCVPTFYNIKWQNTSSTWTENTDVVYWKPHETSTTAGDHFLHTPPKTISEYEGIIALVKVGTQYTVARYFFSSSGVDNGIIDLTSIDSSPFGNDVDIANNITVIGSEAFGRDEQKTSGKIFVLPTSVTTIGERAFYRKGSNGAKVITYKKTVTENGEQVEKYVSPNSGTLNTLDSYSGDGYCCLPTSVTTIERNAFYNNSFKYIELPSSLTYLGKSAFYTNVASSVTDISIGQGSSFSAINDGIYYNGDNTVPKTLLYQAGNKTGTMTIASGTKAIGMHAAANTKYTTITFNNSVETVYGGAFYNCANLTTVNGDLSSIKYLSAVVEGGYSNEPATMNDHFDIIDYRNYTKTSSQIFASRQSAFASCAKLTTIDFTSMTSLKKIGRAAFYNCSTLNTMTNGVGYNFYSGTINNKTAIDTNYSTGVLDLSKCGNLRVVDVDSFVGCSALKYVILPNSTGDDHRATSNMYYGYDPDATSYVKQNILTANKKVKVLIGETVYQADVNIGGKTKVEAHYPAESIFGTGNNATTSNQVYYRVFSIDDVAKNSSGNYYTKKYWTMDPQGNYFLFSTPAEAITYFNNCASYATGDGEFEYEESNNTLSWVQNSDTFTSAALTFNWTSITYDDTDETWTLVGENAAATGITAGTYTLTIVLSIETDGNVSTKVLSATLTGGAFGTTGLTYTGTWDIDTTNSKITFDITGLDT